MSWVEDVSRWQLGLLDLLRATGHDIARKEFVVIIVSAASREPSPTRHLPHSLLIYLSAKEDFAQTNSGRYPSFSAHLPFRKGRLQNFLG